MGCRLLCKYTQVHKVSSVTVVTITPLSVPTTVQSYHPLVCPAQVFHPTGGTETSASLSQTEECF